MKPAAPQISPKTPGSTDFENRAPLPHSPVSDGRGVCELCGSNDSRVHVAANPPERDTRTLDLFEDDQQ
ncbi:hypothetical protein [Cupriavidus necator]